MLTVNTTEKYGIIEFENKTNGKATVTIGDEDSTGDFTITTKDEYFTVTCDLACIVMLYNESEETYTRVEYAEATENTNSYKFGYELNDLKFIIALKGDVSLNGKVNIADSMLINRSLLSDTMSAYRPLTEIERVVADVTKNGTVNIADSMKINRSLLSETASAYSKLEW